MSKVKIAVVAFIALVVITVGVGVGVNVALAHRDRERAEATSVALAEAAGLAEAEAAAAAEALDQECAALVDEYIETELSRYVNHGPDYEVGDYRFGEYGANLVARHTQEWAAEALVPLDCGDEYYVDLFIAAKAEADAYVEVNAPEADELAPEYAALIGH